MSEKVLLAAALAALPVVFVHTHAQASVGHDGKAILRMCQGADKVKALSVMCHSYLNGYLDMAAWQASQSGQKTGHCLDVHAKEGMPAKLVLWLRAHPGEQATPAPALLGRALKDLYPCR